METIEHFLSSHPYSETTKRTYRDVLSQIFAQCDPAAITAAQLLKILNKSEWGNSRQCVALAATQKFIRWKYGSDHPALTAKLKRQDGKPQRALTPAQALELLASFDTYTPKGARNLAICALALDTGLRAAELCNLQQADTDTEKCVLQVIVKGGQWKAAIFSHETAQYVERWKVFRKVSDGQGYLFTNVHTSEGLTPEGLFKVVQDWGKNIGIKLSPHDLRRSFAVIATESGAPERTLMEGGRWTNTAMITRYTRTLKLEAMRRYLPVPKITKYNQDDSA